MGNAYFLLPGPTQVPQEVAMAGAAPMVNHRGPEFAAILEELQSGLQMIFKTKNQVMTLTSSGTGGLEAAIVNFISPGEKVLVASIGNFGERFAKIAAAYRVDVERIDFGWGNCIDPKVIAEKLAADKDHAIKAVICQHNETSTAVVNPIKDVRAAMGDHPALLMVDSVSGLGAADLRVDEWKIDVAIAGSQKAFMAPPGLAFIAVSEKAWAAAEKCTNNRFYLDLRTHREFLAKGQTPWTPAISVFYNVVAALRIIREQGVDKIIAEHYFRRDLIRRAAQALGLSLVAEDHCASPAVTAIYAPEGVAPKALTKQLREKYGVVVAGGQGIMADKAFRIGHLGYVEDLSLLGAVAALEMALTDLGVKVQLGAGVAAAQEMIMHKEKYLRPLE